MLFGKKPFGQNESQDEIVQNRTMLQARAVTFPDTPKVTKEAKAFIQMALTHDQAQRPDVQALCCAPYLRQKKVY